MSGSDDYMDVLRYDTLFSCLMGGMQRAQARYHEKLNTIYVDAPQIENQPGPGVQGHCDNQTKEKP